MRRRKLFVTLCGKTIAKDFRTVFILPWNRRTLVWRDATLSLSEHLLVESKHSKTSYEDFTPILRRVSSWCFIFRRSREVTCRRFCPSSAFSPPFIREMEIQFSAGAFTSLHRTDIC